MPPMTNRTLLIIMSLLSMVLISLHFTDDIVRNISPPGADNVGAVAILVVWLCGTLLLTDRPIGHVIMFIGGLLSAGMPVLHMRGARYPAIATGPGGFFFTWSLIAVGVTGVMAMILAVRALLLVRQSSRIGR